MRTPSCVRVPRGARWLVVRRRTIAVVALAPAALGAALPPVPAGPAAHGTASAHAAPAVRSSHPRDVPRPAPVSFAPYLSLGWGDPPDPAKVMAATGVRRFTLAFVLAHGECEPRWDGGRPLLGGADARAVRAVRAAGGDIVASFGGGDGHKLERSCPDAGSLAAAYRKVIDAYRLKAVDVDIEASAYGSAQVQRKTVGALRRVKESHPRLGVCVTVPGYRSGPGSSLIRRAARAGVEPDAWSVMPFSFVPAAKGEDMGRISIRAVDGLKDRLADAYGYTDSEAYAHSGVSSMAGITAEGETITVEDFRTIAAHARKHRLGRLAFWSVNRDRPCGHRPYPAGDACSGVRQRPWQYTKSLARYGR
jgi:chitinase